MKTVLRLGAVTLAFVGGAALCVPSAMAAKDNFNRSNLGNHWAVTAGNLYITNDQLQGDTGSLGYDKKSANDSTVSATVYINGTDLQYGAVASGDIAGGNNAFVKLQSENADGLFEYGGFYVGNNGGGDFFQLNSTVPSPAKLTVSFCGTTAKMTIKSSAGTQKYTYDYGATFGNGGGLGTYGPIALDNYRSKAGSDCAPDPEAIPITRSNAKDPTLAK